MRFFVHQGELIATDMNEKWFLLVTHGLDSPDMWTWHVLGSEYGWRLYAEHQAIENRTQSQYERVSGHGTT
jgi:hypothetical protein